MTYHKKPNNLTLKDEFIMKNEFVFFCHTDQSSLSTGKMGSMQDSVTLFTGADICNSTDGFLGWYS